MKNYTRNGYFYCCECMSLFACAVVFSVVYESVSSIRGPYGVCSVMVILMVVIFMKTYLFWCR
jgi:hypothetical protein